MPTFISKFGIWEPASEYVVDPNAPKGKEVYSGPDRAALQMIDENGGQLGRHFRTDLETVSTARKLGFKDLDEYLHFMGYDEKKAEQEFEKKAGVIVEHKAPARKPGAKVEGGGIDTSGQGNHMQGDFKSPPINVPRMKE